MDRDLDPEAYTMDEELEWREDEEDEEIVLEPRELRPSHNGCVGVPTTARKQKLWLVSACVPMELLLLLLLLLELLLFLLRMMRSPSARQMLQLIKRPLDHPSRVDSSPRLGRHRLGHVNEHAGCRF